MLKLLGLEVSSRPSCVPSSSHELGQGWLFAASCDLADTSEGKGLLRRMTVQRCGRRGCGLLCRSVQTPSWAMP